MAEREFETEEGRNQIRNRKDWRDMPDDMLELLQQVKKHPKFREMYSVDQITLDLIYHPECRREIVRLTEGWDIPAKIWMRHIWRRLYWG